MTTVKDILREKGHNIWSITPDATVYEALQKMADKEIGAILIVRNDKLLGIFSERDYARKLILKGHLSKESRIAEFMTSDVISVCSATKIPDCMDIMTQKHIRHLPVVDNDKLCGIISIGDIVRAVIQTQKLTIENLENYILRG